MKKLVVPLLILLAAASAESFADRVKPIVTVLDFRVSGVSEQEAAILTDYLTAHLVETGEFRVIDRNQRRTILGEMKFSYDGCTDEECQLEIGKLLAAGNIFVGSIGKLGTRYIINISYIEVETGESLKSFSEKYPDLDSLVDDTGRIAGIFTGEDESPAAPAVKAEEIPVQDSPVPASPLKPVQAQPAQKKLPPMYTDFGILAGGPLENIPQFDGIGWGLFLGGGFSVADYLYLGGEVSILISTEDSRPAAG